MYVSYSSTKGNLGSGMSRMSNDSSMSIPICNYWVPVQRQVFTVFQDRRTASITAGFFCWKKPAAATMQRFSWRWGFLVTKKNFRNRFTCNNTFSSNYSSICYLFSEVGTHPCPSSQARKARGRPGVKWPFAIKESAVHMQSSNSYRQPKDLSWKPWRETLVCAWMCVCVSPPGQRVSFLDLHCHLFH